MREPGARPMAAEGFQGCRFADAEAPDGAPGTRCHPATGAATRAEARYLGLRTTKKN